MLSVDDALRLVLEHAMPLAPHEYRLVQLLGRVLAEPVVSDIDSPPHDKATVDGYAVRSDDVNQPGAVLQVIEEVTAGAVPTHNVTPGTATRIMTGAPIPVGADAVVMVEQTVAIESDRVQINASAVRSGQNITRRASSMARGQTVLERGRRVRAIELGLLAELGRPTVKAVREPQVFILATGNELVNFWETPGPGQIRNSNSLLLWGLVTQAAAFPFMKKVLRDDEAELRKGIAEAIYGDVVVLSGGVSAGVLDLVPKVLTDLGVEQVFHKVNLKPGKPLWFGVKRHAELGRQTLVFGLPGNPVSSLVCFELFVRPAIEKLSGREPRGLPRTTARLTKEHRQRGERPTYWPAVIEGLHDKSVTPLAWQGSGDLRTLADANCLAYFPGGDRTFQAGETVEALLFV